MTRVRAQSTGDYSIGSRKTIIRLKEKINETDKIKIMVFTICKMDGAPNRQTCDLYDCRVDNYRLGSYRSNVRIQ